MSIVLCWCLIEDVHTTSKHFESSAVSSPASLGQLGMQVLLYSNKQTAFLEMYMRSAVCIAAKSLCSVILQFCFDTS
jgi:hypothetical protein